VLAFSKTSLVLAQAFKTGFWIRSQAPLSLAADSEPESDLAVVKGRMEDYSDHPTTALLIVEISDSTLLHDRGIKSSLYAKAGIEDYWIVNLVDRQVEIYRQPQRDAGKRCGHGYATMTVLNAGANVAPLGLPGAAIAVSDLLR